MMKATQASGFFPAAREMIHTISPTTARRKWPKMTGAGKRVVRACSWPVPPWAIQVPSS